MNVARPGASGGAAAGSEGGPPASGGGGPAPERRFAEVLADRSSSPAAATQGPSGPFSHGPSSPSNAPVFDDDIAPAPKAAELSRQRPNPTSAESEARWQGSGGHGLQEIGERSGRAPSADPVGAAANDPSLTWQKVATGALDAEKRVDAMIEAAQKGKSFSAQELLGLQMEVFRYSQTVEMVSHATDKLVGAIKQTLGTQV